MNRTDGFFSLIYDFMSILMTSMIVIMLLFTFVFRIAGVIGPSMNETLLDGDRLIVTAFLPRPQRGDIVIITQPNSIHEPIVKRVVGLPGEWVDIDAARGVVLINGIVLEEPYVVGSTNDLYDREYPVKVPDGCYFVMGDNRNNSTDSRSDQIGFIEKNYMLGKVFYRFSPAGSGLVE